MKTYCFISVLMHRFSRIKLDQVDKNLHEDVDDKVIHGEPGLGKYTVYRFVSPIYSISNRIVTLDHV